jgi:hypothetical protein
VCVISFNKESLSSQMYGLFVALGIGLLLIVALIFLFSRDSSRGTSRTFYFPLSFAREGCTQEGRDEYCYSPGYSDPSLKEVAADFWDTSARVPDGPLTNPYIGHGVVSLRESNEKIPYFWTVEGEGTGRKWTLTPIPGKGLGSGRGEVVKNASGEDVIRFSFAS